eukprot:gb/GECG01003804.1/.p1 GENE.gb/GECG01003804.1/~~gb/GECG01003804.1/.p1  ORF type:complete len:252 (+),score=20.50 gb/GECG01003804.1/:1-756(+)
MAAAARKTNGRSTRAMKAPDAMSLAASREDRYRNSLVGSTVEKPEKGVRENRLRIAKESKYMFHKFPGLRSSESFAKSVWFNKASAKDNMLSWQPTSIKTSLLNFSLKVQRKTASTMHEHLLSYCGEKKATYPAFMAQEILQKGLEQPDLRDEIYLQLCKHITNNPSTNSQLRAWQIMLMCLGTFPPSEELELYLTNFIASYREVQGPARGYARFAIMRLDTVMKSGASMRIPNLEDINGYRARPENPTPP